MNVAAGTLLWWPKREPIPDGWVKDGRVRMPGNILIRKVEPSVHASTK